MLTILSLFGRSPFTPLQSHANKVSECVHQLPSLFEAIENSNEKEIERIAKEISLIEHEADTIKNDIRNHLPKSLYLPINRGDLLEILTLQDRIADQAEDAAVLTTLKPLKFSPLFKNEFQTFLTHNIETFDDAHRIIKELHELAESSFGGVEAEKVRNMVDVVAKKEHEVDLIQRELLKNLYKSEDQMTYTSFYQWQRLFQSIASISNVSENLAYRIRMTLELK